ncbi:hypothetical protein FPV67DRAFT_1729807 [Lyophyllum atratum]|nr:hypothetical protein FPV67DRAFT_1729807 [Lyophyllum atratum]
MPGPGKKAKASKGKTKGKPDSAEDPATVITKPADCQTLEEDEMTRCSEAATEGRFTPERCRVHQSQYRTLYKKYKEASLVVDRIEQSKTIPTKEQVDQYTDLHVVPEKTRWLREYLEAIRVERTGRDIHQRRFFLKADDGHKIRIKVLAKEMGKAVDGLDGLYTRASELHFAQSTAVPEWVKSSRSESRPASDSGNLSSGVTTKSTQSVMADIDALKLSDDSKAPPHIPPTSEMEDDDLIDVELKTQKAGMLRALEILCEPEVMFSFLATQNPSEDGDIEHIRYIREYGGMVQLVLCQYARRIIWHEPTLCYKALDKVSFRDFILSDEITVEDMAKFFEVFAVQRLRLGLLWLKDAAIEALAMSRPGVAGTAANVGDPKNRYPVLGGWIFNRAHAGTMSNEAWFYLIKLSEPPADVENRFVRLCNNFDDLISFLSFGAIGLIPPPSFCSMSNSPPPLNPVVARNHLSLCGVAVTDLISTGMPISGPFPNRHKKAQKAGCIVWSEAETRAYMFGALRNEPDAFTDAFLRELRARPDIFQVVTRSETDTGRKVDIFGDGPGAASPEMRYRMFEAPPASLANRPQGYGDWEVARSAIDVFYGTKTMGQGIVGYLAQLSQGGSGWFFNLKKFPVKYFVILDAVAGQHHAVLANQVAWAALRAKGYAEGEYSFRKYALASDKLFQKCAEERLGWRPKAWPSWHATKMEDGL